MWYDGSLSTQPAGHALAEASARAECQKSSYLLRKAEAFDLDLCCGQWCFTLAHANQDPVCGGCQDFSNRLIFFVALQSCAIVGAFQQQLSNLGT